MYEQILFLVAPTHQNSKSHKFVSLGRTNKLDLFRYVAALCIEQLFHETIKFTVSHAALTHHRTLIEYMVFDVTVYFVNQ